MVKLSFIWFGIKGRYGIWEDGLWGAMKLLESEYDVTYHEPTDDIDPDSIVLFWEALCTCVSKDKEMFERVRNLPNKKALLFAGGPIRQEWLNGFDHYFWESKIDGDEFERMGTSNSCAFGINEKVFYPQKQPKVFDVSVFGTCASWKRQGMIGKAIGNRLVVAGRNQETDPQPFIDCRNAGSLVFDELHPKALNTLVNASHCVVNGAEKMGGGQRVTLEAMSAGIPVICMSDSPKNREYVEESGFGLVVDPNVDDIRTAVERIKDMRLDPGIGRSYIESKWSSVKYAEYLNNWISLQ